MKIHEQKAGQFRHLYINEHCIGCGGEVKMYLDTKTKEWCHPHAIWIQTPGNYGSSEVDFPNWMGTYYEYAEFFLCDNCFLKNKKYAYYYSTLGDDKKTREPWDKYEEGMRVKQVASQLEIDFNTDE